MTDTLTFIHGGLYDGLDLNSKQNIRNLLLAEEDTSANKIARAEVSFMVMFKAPLALSDDNFKLFTE